MAKKTKIKIVAFVALVASIASIACGNEKVRQCVAYLNTSVENTKEHKIKKEAWRAFQKEKERLKNTETEKNTQEWKTFLEAYEIERNTKEHKERETIKEKQSKCYKSQTKTQEK